ELAHLFDAARQHRDVQHDTAIEIQLRAQGGDAYIVGKRLFELVEKLRPGKGAPVDQIVGLPGFDRRRFDLLDLDAVATLCGRRPDLSGPLLVLRACAPGWGVRSEKIRAG